MPPTSPRAASAWQRGELVGEYAGRADPGREGALGEEPGARHLEAMGRIAFPSEFVSGHDSSVAISFEPLPDSCTAAKSSLFDHERQLEQLFEQLAVLLIDTVGLGVARYLSATPPNMSAEAPRACV